MSCFWYSFVECVIEGWYLIGRKTYIEEYKKLWWVGDLVEYISIFIWLLDEKLINKN